MPLSEDNTTVDPDFIGLKLRSVDGAVATAASQGVKFVLSFLSQIWLAAPHKPGGIRIGCDGRSDPGLYRNTQ